MRVWRLMKESYALSLDDAFAGEGARLFGGRWNQRGVSMAYSAATLSLALVEALAHADLEDLPSDLVAASVVIPDHVSVVEMDQHRLPSNWRDIDPVPSETQRYGSHWCKEGTSLILVVPSVLIPSENNYLINPAHPDFSLLEDFRVEPFRIDPRLGLGFI
ncbi:MAG: RES domain-containing protein [Motiliproteus sp.]|jgi:RES domain-containing protein